ncbi:MAG: hypothetical protein U1F60_02545 [Planctomycetota bacterium]
MLRRFAHVVVFLAALAATALGIRRLDTEPVQSWMRMKLDHFAAVGDQYDTVFVGSSRLNFGLDPERFDARMAELGQPTRSYNLAFGGMRQHDFTWVLAWLAEHRPPKLRRVLVELHEWSQWVRGGQWYADQDIELHTLDLLWPRCRSVLLDLDGPLQKLEQLRFVVAHTALNALSVGRGPRLVDGVVRHLQGEPGPAPTAVPRHGAARIEDVTEAPVLANRRAFLADPEPATTARKKITELVEGPWPSGCFDRASFAMQVQRLRALGVEPMFVVMPTWERGFRGRDGIAEVEREVRVLDLDHPLQNRPLFDRALYFDQSHLNEAGCTRFSDYLAERLVEFERLPLGASCAPQPLPDGTLQLRVERVDGGDRVLCTASNLPFTGTLAVVAADRLHDTPLPNGQVLRIPLPAPLSTELGRTEDLDATNHLDLGSLPRDRTIYLQCGVLADGELITVSNVVELPPR